jgi:hypothetical protein
MGFTWRFWGTGRRGPAGRARRRRVEFLALEDRRLCTVTAVTAVASPRVIPPADGRFVPVTVSGTATQLILTPLPGSAASPPSASQRAAVDAANVAKAGPNLVLGLVTDQYRTVEPRVRTNVSQLLSSVHFYIAPTAGDPTPHEALIRKYSYSFTVYLQASSHTGGRQYDITVFATDSQGGNQKSIAARVPHGR